MRRSMGATAAPQVPVEDIARVVSVTRAARSGPSARNGSQASPHTRWQTIEVRHLAALATVAREGSFRRAADRLGYVQSAISGQIAHLEQAVGTRLLERASGTPVVALTDAGRILLRHTDEILARFETAYEDVNSLGSRTGGAVRVAGLEHFSPRRIAAILSLFRQRHPFARMTLLDPSSDAAGAALIASDDLDLLICESPPGDDSLTQLVLERDEYVLLVKSGSQLSVHSKLITAAELIRIAPMVPSASMITGTLAEQLRDLGIEPHSSVVPDSVTTAQALVCAGLGAAIVPSRLVDWTEPSTVAVDLSHLLVPHTVVLVLNEERAHSTAVYGFVHALREICDAEAEDADDPPQTGIQRERTGRVRSRAA
jgi:DNA-binding transcriptional LysR family regulator